MGLPTFVRERSDARAMCVLVGNLAEVLVVCGVFGGTIWGVELFVKLDF